MSVGVIFMITNVIDGIQCANVVEWQNINLMSLKQFNAKQAEKWLQKLKTQNVQSYKDITKFLRKYERTQDDFDCYVKISHTLLSHTQLTKEINNYMEEENKFVINRPEDEKIKQLMEYVKKNRPDIFQRIITMIQELSRTNGQNQVEISKMLKPRLKEIIKGDPELERITEEALDLTGQELINRKNLQHLKMPKPILIEQDKQISRPQNSQPETKNHKQQIQTKPVSKINVQPKPFIIPFTNPSQEKVALKQLEKNSGQAQFNYLMKLTHIYTLNIITKNQLFELLAGVQLKPIYMECIKDILDTRESQRRTHSHFKPLSDTNFGQQERPSPSYVAMPPYYPIICSSKTPQLRLLLNEKYVSVTYGSQESDNFSVRNKNLNEINLLKAQDQRYQFDIYMKRLEKTEALLNKLLDPNQTKTQEQVMVLVNKILSMRVLQLIYKNCHRQQREEFQWFLKSNVIETCQLFKERLSMQISQLKQIKQVHALKSWSEVAIKNFYKALDLKGFEFKKNEKDHMKASFFLTQLQEKAKILQNGGQNRSLISFEDKKQFFTVFNSFESSSRTQKCATRKLPVVQKLDLQDQARRRYYPLMIMAFQDQKMCEYTYTLIIFYIETALISESQKIRCKAFLEQLLVGTLGWKLPPKRMPSESLDQEKLLEKIGGSEEVMDFSSWVTQQQQVSSLPQAHQKTQEQVKKQKNLGFLQDQPSVYSYLPASSTEKAVVFGSEHIYTLVRFIYAAYERLIRMREVAQSPQHLQLFELLFFSCIKAKQGIKFEQNLNLLFSKHAYLFSTLYKLFDNLIKSLSSASICPISAHSFKHSKQISEELYLVQLNRFCLNNNLTNNKILRLTYDDSNKLLYVNSFQSYYKWQDIGKDVTKRRLDISKSIEIYTLDTFDLGDFKRDLKSHSQYLNRNNCEYIFEGNSIKMLNHMEKEDILVSALRRQPWSKTVKRELKRVHKLIPRIC